MAFGNRVDPLDAAARSYAAQILREAELHNIKVSLPPDTTDWDAIFSAEATIIKNLQGPFLRRRAWVVYDRYAEVAGAEKAARRAAANTLNVDTCEAPVLTADLLQIHNETARIYMIGFQVERQRAELTRFVLAIAMAGLVLFMSFLGWASLKGNLQPEDEPLVLSAIVLVLLLAGAVYMWFRRRKAKVATMIALALLLTFAPRSFAQAPSPAPVPAPVQTSTQQPAPPQEPKKTSATASTTPRGEKPPPRVPIVPIVMIAGILGATFSILQRVQRNTSTDPLLALLSFRAARPQVFLSVASGAIGALVLYAVFTGGMIEGTIFPKIVNSMNPTDDKTMLPLYHFLRESGPANHASYGKLLVWAFVAGFAERFVPDILDRFTATSKK